MTTVVCDEDKLNKCLVECEYTFAACTDTLNTLLLTEYVIDTRLIKTLKECILTLRYTMEMQSLYSIWSLIVSDVCGQVCLECADIFEDYNLTTLVQACRRTASACEDLAHTTMSTQPN